MGIGDTYDVLEVGSRCVTYDILTVLSHGEPNLNTFQDYLNALQPTTKFSYI
jgi:hypothetical protein